MGLFPVSNLCLPAGRFLLPLSRKENYTSSLTGHFYNYVLSKQTLLFLIPEVLNVYRMNKTKHKQNPVRDDIFKLSPPHNLNLPADRLIDNLGD